MSNSYIIYNLTTGTIYAHLITIDPVNVGLNTPEGHGALNEDLPDGKWIVDVYNDNKLKPLN